MADTYLFYCPVCHAERVAPRSLIGRRVRCADCNELVTAPPPTTPAERQLADTWDADQQDSEFDAYYKWLAIPPAEQPPNYYRLLGLPLFEDDPDVISISTDRQMSHVRAQAGGKRAVESQRLLNELAHASVCLLDPQKKTAYDRQLREQQASNAPGEALTSKPATDAAATEAGRPVGTGTVSGFEPISSPTEVASGESAEDQKRPASTAKASAKKITTDAPEAVTKQGPTKDAKAAKDGAIRTQLKQLQPVQTPPLQPLPQAPPRTHTTKQPEAERESPPVSFAREEDSLEAEMDMTPMVDVTFLLLIFFMVTAAFALQRSFQVPTPDTDQPSQTVAIEDVEEDPDVVIVRVDAFGTYRVMTPDWDQEAPSEQELLIKLREARDTLGPSQLLVIANGEALHGRVVTVFDAGASVGMERVKLVTVEEDEY